MYRIRGHVLLTFHAYEYSIKTDQSGLRKGHQDVTPNAVHSKRKHVTDDFNQMGMKYKTILHANDTALSKTIRKTE